MPLCDPSTPCYIVWQWLLAPHATHCKRTNRSVGNDRWAKGQDVCHPRRDQLFTDLALVWLRHPYGTVTRTTVSSSFFQFPFFVPIHLLLLRRFPDHQLMLRGNCSCLLCSDFQCWCSAFLHLVRFTCRCHHSTEFTRCPHCSNFLLCVTHRRLTCHCPMCLRNPLLRWTWTLNLEKTLNCGFVFPVCLVVDHFSKTIKELLLFLYIFVNIKWHFSHFHFLFVDCVLSGFTPYLGMLPSLIYAKLGTWLVETGHVLKNTRFWLVTDQLSITYY